MGGGRAATQANRDLRNCRLRACTRPERKRDLTENTTLVHLDLSSNRLCGLWLESGTKEMGTYDASGIKTLTRALARNSALMDLSLRSNVLGFSGAEAVVDMLHENTILRNCDVRSTGVGEEGKQLLNDAAKVLSAKRGMSILA